MTFFLSDCLMSLFSLDSTLVGLHRTNRIEEDYVSMFVCPRIVQLFIMNLQKSRSVLSFILCISLTFVGCKCMYICLIYWFIMIILRYKV